MLPQNVLPRPSDAHRFIDIPAPQNVLPGPSDADWLSMFNEDLSDCKSDPECHPRSQPF